MNFSLKMQILAMQVALADMGNSTSESAEVFIRVEAPDAQPMRFKEETKRKSRRINRKQKLRGF